jgi:hypothetical protein
MLCLEIRKYLHCINKNLTNAVKIGHFKIARLSLAYDMLSNAQDKINKQFGLFLLLDLSQLLFNILYIPLWVISSCFQHDIKCEFICPLQKFIGSGFLMFTYMSRFLVVLWGCSVVASEVKSTLKKKKKKNN